MDYSGQYGQNINNFQGQPQVVMNGMPPNYPQNNMAPEEKKDRSGLIKTICLIFTSLIAIVFIGLFVFMYLQWDTAHTDVDGQVEKAVAIAENNLRTELEENFAKKEKYPYSTFGGPSDFGSLTFEYPKTWSLYIPNDASNASDYHAYMNPGAVYVANDKTVMALRVSIVNKLTDKVKTNYTKKVQKGTMTVSTKVVNGINVDVYKGLLDSKYYGFVCIFKIRDKTAIIQTDAYIFEEDFNRVLETIRFNA